MQYYRSACGREVDPATQTSIPAEQPERLRLPQEYSRPAACAASFAALTGSVPHCHFTQPTVRSCAAMPDPAVTAAAAGRFI
ncbi:MAG: hypothetical protein ACI4RK_04855 [Oscillospiraceae bacterium]